MLMSLCFSCKKPSVNQSTSSFFFHFTCEENGYVIDYYQRTDIIALPNEPGNNMTDVYFRSPYYECDNSVFQDDSITEFSFGFEASPRWSWFVNAYCILEGEKYYYDSSLMEKHRFFDDYMTYNESNGTYNKLLSGWMSFSRPKDDCELVLRIDYEADFLMESNGVIDTLKYRNCRIDFSTNMAERIRGGDRLR
jgi:hypothetical protein